MGMRKTAGILILLGLHPDVLLKREEFEKKCEELPENQEKEQEDPERWDGMS